MIRVAAFRRGSRFVWTAVILLAWLGFMPSRADAVEQLCDPSYQDCRAPLLTLIQNETVGIDVGLWFMTDARYSNLIVQKWQAGVRVRVLMDPRQFAQGTQGSDNHTIMDQLQSAGIPMRNRTASGIEHWKAMIFAGQNTVYFGSANFSAYAFVPLQPYVNYTDETVYFTDDASIVQSFMTKFDDAWVDTTNYANYANVPATLSRTYPTYPIDPDLNFVPDQDFATRSVSQYNAETQKIDVTMFRITDQRHTNAIINAVNRGIPVRLMIDDGEYRLATRLWDAWNVDRLYAAGVTIRQSAHQGENHGKLVLLYGLGESIFGSSNWSSPSGDIQHEHNYFTKNPAIFNWFVTYFERRWNNSNPAGAIETTPFMPLPPDTPVYKTPANGATGLATSGVQIVWDGGPWAHLYDIYFGTSPPPPLYASNQTLGPDDPNQSPPQYQHVSLPPLQPGTTYYWQIVSKTMANMTATGPVWSFTTSGTAGSAALPAPWVDGDIGSTGIVGSASYSNGTFNVAGSGADIWGTADAFHFVYQSLSGDGELVARVASLQNVASWSKAGVMIRDTLDPGSAFAFMLVSAAKGTGFHYRTAAGASALGVAGTASAAPVWVRIVRSGNTITGYQSPDGTTWQQIGSATFTMGTSVLIGLAVTSHDNTQLCTATFDNVVVSGAVGATPPGMPASPVPATGATGVTTHPTLTWTSTGATSYDVAFGTANPPPPVSTGQSTASYAPPALATNTQYFWQVTAHNSGGTTAGPVWSFTTAASVPAPWQDGDIGLVGVAGSASYANGVFTVSGSGADIWGTADAFHFVYQALSGDGAIVARVASVQNVASWSKAGVMIRDTLDPGSAFAFMLVSAAKGTAFQYRTAAGISALGTGGTAAVAPVWVRVVRSGSTITGYQSPDGTTWQPIGSATFAMGASVYIGLAVSSHNNTQLCTAPIDNVTMTGAAGTSPPGTPASPVPANGATGVSTQPTLTWTSPGATSYDVAFGTTNPPPAVSIGQSTASYAPPALAANTQYFWQITAYNGAGTTAGPVWSFTTAVGLPAPWQDGDIGAVGVAGSASYANGVFTVSGSGADIWGTADAFHFVYQPLTGDGQLIARVASVQNVATWSKAGVMIRDTLDPGSAYALMLVSAAKGTALQYRTSAGALAAGIAGTSAAAPLWVKIVRSGTTIAGYQSPDGINWTLIGNVTISMGSTVQIGLAVTSHNNAATATATFDAVSQ